SPYVHRPPEPSDPTSRGLELIQMHYVARHGARYPTRGNMESIRNLFKTIGPHVPQDWIKPDLVDPKNTGRLASGGEKEISAIAGRMAIRYAEFLKNLFTDNQRIRFVSSEWQRSMESARVFRDTVDPDGRTLPVTVVPVTNDTTLAIRFACPLWNLLRGIHAVDIARETAVFDSIHSHYLQTQMSQKLSSIANRPISLTMKEVATIYSMCAFDLALYNEPNHWCTLLDPQSALLLELRNDIKFSRVYGPYGPPINKHMACVLFTDILEDIDRALADPKTAVSTFRFAHAETIMFVSALLGLENVLGKGDAPITGNMTLASANSRGFKSTQLVPFSANIGIEVYRDTVGPRGFFRLLLNEQPVRLPGCDDAYCPIEILRSSLSENVGCSFGDMCKNK
ncbi:hypothetical protein GGI05_004247, partial [Coemansia sp. RSA 2603]